MGKVLGRLLDPANQAVVWATALVFLLLFQFALGDITLDAARRPISLWLSPDWAALVGRVRASFQFEAVGVLEAPYVVWLISPMNLLIGLTLGLLTGVQAALVRIARNCAASCGLGSASGLLAGLPALLAGGACCAPLFALLLGLQLTASLIAVIALLIPAAFALLVLGLVWSLRVAARNCARAD